MADVESRSLEELLEAGEVTSALLLKGDGWTDRERDIARQAWEAGLAANVSVQKTQSLRAELHNAARNFTALADEKERLRNLVGTLTTLVRIGFLLSVDGERATSDIVRDPETRGLLMSILQAVDSNAAAISAVNFKPTKGVEV